LRWERWRGQARSADSDFAGRLYSLVSRIPSGLAKTQFVKSDRLLEVDDVLQPGTLVIEACTNLGGWLPIFTNTTPTNVLFYTDPAAGNYPGRFYRAYQYP